MLWAMSALLTLPARLGELGGDGVEEPDAHELGLGVFRRTVEGQDQQVLRW